MGPFQCWMMVYASVLSMRCHPRQVPEFDKKALADAMAFAAKAASASVNLIEKEVLPWASEPRSEAHSN